jgi:hypothetical protein
MLLAATTSVVGCSENAREPGSEENPPAAGAGAGEMGHQHDEGPHGGAIADWGGGEYHVEFTVDHEKQEATIYVLDANAQSPAPVPAESLLLTISDPSFQVELQPVPLEGEAEGTSSRFVGQHEKLGVVQEFAGTISGAVAGTPYAGDFEEHAHEH